MLYSLKDDFLCILWMLQYISWYTNKKIVNFWMLKEFFMDSIFEEKLLFM